MNAKDIALCSIFVAIAVVLGYFTIPVGPMIFYFWEIPVVVALLLYGFKMGFSVAAISVFTMTMLIPKSIGILFPIWNLIAMTTTLLAITLTQWLITHKTSSNAQTRKHRFNFVIFFVIATMGIRLAVMPFVNYFMYKYMMPIVVGTVYTEVYLVAVIPALLIYDAILVLYTVPTGYIIARRVNKDLKNGNTLV